MKEKQKNRKKAIKIISFSIIGFILIFSIISMIIVKTIYDRQFPRFNRHDETITASLRYKDFEENYPRKLVNFKSGDNLLQGYVYGEDNDLGLVVIVHGIGGGADSYLPQIIYFVNQGWRVFSYDSTGSYDSEGKTTKGFPQSVIDLDNALTYIKDQSEFSHLPILLFGHSWGGYAVANVLNYDHDIAGVVTVSGANSSMELILEQGHKMMGSFIYTQYPYLYTYERILFGKEASLNALDSINKSNVPVFIIHGSEDETISYKGSSIIANVDNITNPNVRILLINEPGKNGHNNLFRSDAALDYISEINTLYKELYESYNQNIPYQVKQEFYSKINRELAQDMNLELMEEIQLFFNQCVN